MTFGIIVKKYEHYTKPTELELAWMAGFFDGEGSIEIGVYTNRKTNTIYRKKKCFQN